ncbi:hypothetical protein Tco_0001821 [Tanacetum coccineum]
MPMDDLLHTVPKLISRIDSLELDLKQTKLTMGNAIVKLVKKVKKLEGFLKRRNLVLTDSEDEEPEVQGRKSQADPQDSSKQGLVTPPTTKAHASGEEQEEEISPNTLEAAKTLSKVASLKSRSIDKGRRYKRRKESTGKKVVSSLDFQEDNTGAEKINTAGEVNAASIEVNTASKVNTGSIELNTVIEQDSTAGENKGQREGKAPMLSEETPKKTKEQILQEEASLAEAIRLDSLQREEEAKQIHLDALLAQRIAEEEELTEQQKKRKAQVQFEAQHYTNEDWDLIRAKLEANAELSKSMLGSEPQGEDFAKKMVELVNQRKKFFAEERAKAKRNKPMTQSQLKTYMMNYLKNQGSWKLNQLRKLSFEEVKEEFDKLIKQIDSFAPISFEATKDSLKRFGEELQTKTSKRLKEDKDDEAKGDAPTKKLTKRRKQIARKGMHTSMDENVSDDSDKVDEQEETNTGTETPLNPVPVAMKTPSVATYKIIKQGEKGLQTHPSDEHTYEEQSPVHHHFSPSQAQAPSHMPTADLLQTIPKLISRIDSLELDLKQTKLTMGNAIVKLVKKVKKLEGFLKRRNLVLTDSEDEEPEVQGRNSQADPQDSSKQGLYCGKIKDKEEGKLPMAQWKKTPNKTIRNRILQEEVALQKLRLDSLQREEAVNFKEKTLTKEMVDLVNQRKKFFAEERAKAKRNKPMTQSQLKTYMMNYLKNQGSWKLNQLRKLSFDEVKKEFDKLVKQVESFAPISFEATKDSLKRFGEELQTKTPKRLKEDKDDEAKDDEPTKKSGKRRKQIARKGMHTSVDKNDSEDSDKVGEQEETGTGTETPINPVPVAMKTPSVATYKIIKQGEKGVYQIVREDGTDIVYINFGAMMKSISRDDLTELYRIVMNRYGMDGPEDKLEKGFWKCLRIMFEEPLSTDSIWSEIGQQKIISWRYYDTCRVHCLNLESMDVYMLSDRKYPLSAEVCQTMLKMKLLDGKMNEDCYRLLKMMEKQAGIRK